ncbi:MAG: hypothetical protein WCV41_02575 [Patescibacteria group bacterium]
MEKIEQYKALMSEIIAKQIVILGPQIAVIKARSVAGLTINDAGLVEEVKGDPAEALQSLIDVYVSLSGLIVKNALGSIFSKYPGLKNGASS